MSKAEDLSREYVLPFLDKHYEKYGEHKQMELSRFDGYDMMSAYEEGYQQAEKDLALTCRDIADIDNIITEMIKECDSKILYDTEEGFYQEVLNRFNKLKER